MESGIQRNESSTILADFQIRQIPDLSAIFEHGSKTDASSGFDICCVSTEERSALIEGYRL